MIPSVLGACYFDLKIIQVDGKGQSLAIVLTTVLSIFFIFGIGANIAVLVVTQYHRNTLPGSSIFISNLAFVDFIFLLHLPITIGKHVSIIELL